MVATYSLSVTLVPNATHGQSYKMAADTSCDFNLGGQPSSATTAYTDADYANVNTSNNGYFSSSASAIKTDIVGDCIFNRYTFKVTLVNTSQIQWIQYCVEGYYSTNNVGDMLEWYWQNIWGDNHQMTTSDATYCTNFTSNIDSYITNGLFSVGTDAGAYGDGSSDSTTFGYIDYVNVSVGFAGPVTATTTTAAPTTTTTTIPTACSDAGGTCVSSSLCERSLGGSCCDYTGCADCCCFVPACPTTTTTAPTTTTSTTTTSTPTTTTIPINVRVKGIALYYYTGERVNGNVTVIPVETPNDKENSTVSNGEWTVDLNTNTENIQFTIIIDDNQKVGYNEIKLNTPTATRLNCSVQNIFLSGYAVDIDSGNTITSGNVRISVLDTEYTNTTTFTGIWSIDLYPCLIPGKTYSLYVIVSANTGKRGEYLQKYPAR